MAIQVRGELKKQFGRPIARREREVLQHVFDGLSKWEIAAAMKISPRTVEAHRDHIREKFGVKTVGGMLRMAVEQGIVKFQKPMKVKDATESITR